MPNKKQEKRRRKLRVHGPSSDAVGAPPAKRKEPRPAPPARGQRGQRSVRDAPIPSLRRSARKGAFMALFMVGIVYVTTRENGTTSMIIALAETIPLVFLFIWFDLWMARKVYKRVTGQEAPRPERGAGFGFGRRGAAARDAEEGAAEDSDGGVPVDELLEDEEVVEDELVDEEPEDELEDDEPEDEDEELEAEEPIEAYPEELDGDEPRGRARRR